MTVTLDLSPEIEAKLLEEAKMAGVPLETLIVRKIAPPPPVRAVVETPEEKEERIQRLLDIFREVDALPRNPNPGPELEWDEDGLPL